MEVEFLSFEDLQKLVRDDTKEVKRVIHDILSEGGFYVFYQHKNDVVPREQQRTDDLIEVAKEVSTNEEYTALKNNRQREIYLLQFESLTKTDAGDVIELLKPEMAVLFKEQEQ